MQRRCRRAGSRGVRSIAGLPARYEFIFEVSEDGRDLDAGDGRRVRRERPAAAGERHAARCGHDRPRRPAARRSAGAAAKTAKVRTRAKTAAARPRRTAPRASGTPGPPAAPLRSIEVDRRGGMMTLVKTTLGSGGGHRHWHRRYPRRPDGAERHAARAAVRERQREGVEEHHHAEAAADDAPARARRALIALKGGTIDIVEKTGESKKHLWESGKAYWLDRGRAQHPARRRQQRHRTDRGDRRRAAETLTAPTGRPAPPSVPLVGPALDRRARVVTWRAYFGINTVSIT